MKSNGKESDHQSKKFYLSLKPNKSNDNRQNNLFNRLTDVLISFHLFPFFDTKEAKEFGKINIKFYNSFVRYYERASDNLIKQYNVKIEKGKEYIPNEIYEQKDDKGHFIKLNLLNLEHYLLFSYFDWTWKNDDRYWEKMTPKNSLLNKDIYHLRSVCWLDTNANMTHLYNGKYKLYLSHCVCKLAENSIKMTISLDGAPLKEFIYPSRTQVDNCRNIHSEKKEDQKDENVKEPINQIPRGNPRIGLIRGPFMRVRGRVDIPNKEEYNKDNSLNKEYIMDIELNNNYSKDNGIGHELFIKFENRNNNWKRDWFIDGVILQKIN